MKMKLDENRHKCEIYYKDEVFHSKYKKIYLIGVGGNELLNRVIKKFLKEPYAHIALSFERDLEILYAFNFDLKMSRWKIDIINGFVKEKITDYDPEANYSLYSINLNDEQYDELRTLVEKYEKEAQLTSYNYKAAIGFAYESVWKFYKKMNPYSFTCSEFIAYVLQQAKIINFDKPLFTLSPCDILYRPEFTLVKEGRIKAI